MSPRPQEQEETADLPPEIDALISDLLDEGYSPEEITEALLAEREIDERISRFSGKVIHDDEPKKKYEIGRYGHDKPESKMPDKVSGGMSASYERGEKEKVSKAAEKKEAGEKHAKREHEGRETISKGLSQAGRYADRAKVTQMGGKNVYKPHMTVGDRIKSGAHRLKVAVKSAIERRQAKNKVKAAGKKLEQVRKQERKKTVKPGLLTRAARLRRKEFSGGKKAAYVPDSVQYPDNHPVITEKVLSTKARKKLKKGVFGEPGKRKYPMPDASHAANAKARATQMVKRGKLSPAEKAKIDAKANAILGKKKGKKKLHESVETMYQSLKKGKMPWGGISDTLAEAAIKSLFRIEPEKREETLDSIFHSEDAFRRHMNQRAY